MAYMLSRARLGKRPTARVSRYLRAIYGPSIATETPQPSTRRRPQPIVVARDSIASTDPPRAVVRCRSQPTPYRVETPSLPARRPLPIASNTIAVVSLSRQGSFGPRRPVRKTREPAAALCARRKVAWEDDRERA